MWARRCELMYEDDVCDRHAGKLRGSDDPGSATEADHTAAEARCMYLLHLMVKTEVWFG